MFRRGARFRLGLAMVAMVAVPCFSATAAEIPVEGIVRGAEGMGILGARVELRPVVSRFEAGLEELEGRPEPAPVARVAVDRMGRFRLSAPQIGLWRLVVEADGYVPMEIPALPVLEETSLPQVTLRSDSGLRVHVVDADGNPVPGAQVLAQTGKPELWNAGDWQPVKRLAMTGPEGTLRLARAAVEPLRLWAERPGFPAQGGNLADGRDAVLQLQPGVARFLVALDAENHPLPEALFRDPRSALVLGHLDGQPLVLAAPGTGLWDLRVELADGRRMSFRIAEAQRPAGAGPIPLRLTTAVPLAGRIVDSAGQRPLAGALVWSAGDPGSVTWTDAAGAYRLAGRLAGSRFELRAAAANHRSGQIRVGLPFRSPENPRHAPDLPLVAAPLPAIAGVVVDAAGRPVPGAEIRVVKPDPDERLPPPELRLARTAADGSFRIAPLQAGASYELMASRPGFAPVTRFVMVPRPPQSGRPIRLALSRGRTASGLVLDTRQRPIRGATVKLTSSRPSSGQEELEPDPFQATTGTDGGFQIPGLPAGAFELRIEGSELSPLLTKVISVPSGEGLVNLGTFTLEVRSRIAGWIVDPDGRPVEGVEIWVVADGSTSISHAARQAGPAAVSRRDGGFELRDRPVGDHEKLRACLKGFLPAEFQAQGPAATEPRIVLTPSTQISGRVLSADGDPLPGARVSASLSSGPAGSDVVLPDPPCPFNDTSITGAEGDFTLELKSPGRYEVTALGAGHLLAELDHLLVPPEGLEGVEIRMDDGTVVFGHVSDPEGHSVAGASISLAGSRSYTQTSSDGSGDYLLEGVGPGTEHLLIEHPDYETGTEEFNISAKGGRLDLMLLSHVSHFEIRGRVSDPYGAPVEGSIISSSSDKTSTGADGSFVLSVSKGSHDLLAEKEGYSPARVAGVVVEDRSLDGLQIRLSHGLTLTGRVLGVDPAAVTENAVSVLVTGSTFNETLAPIDSTGRFEIPNLPMGEWDLSAQAGERKASDRFTPPSGQAVVVHDLEFASVSEVRGSVTGPHGDPIEGASILLARGSGPDSHAHTLIDGSFAVEVPDGTYTLSASAEGYAGREVERPVVVAGAPVPDVEIQLGTDIVLSGRLLGLERGDTLKELEIEGPPTYRTGAWTVDQEARYRQSGLGPGDWKVTATFLLGNQERYASGKVHIPSSATEATLDLDFHLGDLTLTVRPTTPEGSLDPSLDNADGSDLTLRQSGEDGAYLFSHLGAGTYVLSYHKGDKWQSQLVELTADRELVLDTAP
jgi:hypothetical protein